MTGATVTPRCELGAWGCQNLRGCHGLFGFCSSQRQAQSQPAHRR